ncbi:MAG: hypothetical protein N838_18665 [Thiohalocapsa sp. PB-PSB1]|nr:MAG: hypothetical protein N838_18665 [Thiohalocapsa sp. PB-PSB1]
MALMIRDALPDLKNPIVDAAAACLIAGCRLTTIMVSM